MTYPDYENYERLDSFNPQQLAEYRHMLLDKTRPQVEFIKRHVWEPYRKPLSVVEVGCGNGRLLMSLYRRGLLEFGCGIDLSESRIKFANKWAEEIGDDALAFWQDDILRYEGTAEGADLAVCITGCFQYFYPISPEAPAKLLRFMRGAKYALFELYRKPQMGRTWRKLPDADPWEYLLDEYEDVGDWVRHTKTFLNNKNLYGGYASQDVRVENLAYYELPVFLRHLANAGFTNVHWAKQNSTTQVVLVS